MKGELQRRLGANLRRRRDSLGLTQEGLGELWGYNAKYMSRLETGKCNVTLRTLEHLTRRGEGSRGAARRALEFRVVAKPNEITFTAISFHDSVLPQPLRFAPPFAWKATNPAGFSRFWQFANFAFGLPDPATFPRLSGPFEDEDMRTVRRFLDSAEELAGYTIMSASDSVSVSVLQGKESWTAEFSSSESVRGAAALFRQLHGTDPSGYQVLVKLISKLTQQQIGGATDQRRDMLVAWRRAYGRLLQQRIEAIVGRMVVDARSGSRAPQPLPGEDIIPTQIIDRYFNGDLIHWDRQAKGLEAFRAKDPLMADFDKLHFLEAMCGLAHFYLGFSLLAAAAVGIEPPRP